VLSGGEGGLIQIIVSVILHVFAASGNSGSSDNRGGNFVCRLRHIYSVLCSSESDLSTGR
jgi:hypothetical protein